MQEKEDKTIHPHLAPTDECQCEDYREYLRTKKNKQPNYWIDSECKKYDHYSDRTNMFKEREPQKECDHIVGYLAESGYEGQCSITEVRISSRARFTSVDCEHCPECGEKINLQQSKEEPTEAVMFNLGGKKKPKEEKKECEHKICIKYPLQKNIPLDKVDFFLYCCTNPKCGLVTCIDPNK